MRNISSIHVERKNPRWEYHEAGVCSDLEWRHERVLTPDTPAYRLGCLLVANSTIIAHVKYHKATTAVSWVDATTGGLDLVKGAAYYVDTLVYNNHLYSMKNDKLSPPTPSVYEWDVLLLSEARLLFIRDFDVGNSSRERDLHDLIDAEYSRVHNILESV